MKRVLLGFGFVVCTNLVQAEPQKSRQPFGVVPTTKDATKPAEQNKATEPNKAAEPAKTVAQEKAAEPAKTAEPAKSAKQDKAAEPAKTVAQEKAAEPAKPAAPAKPAESAKPAEPVIPQRPKTRAWQTTKGVYSAIFEVIPGVPEAQQTTELLLSLSKKPERPHPVYGSKIPLSDLDLVVEIADAQNNNVEHYRAHPIPRSSGQYGIHFTAKTSGIYNIRLLGKDGNKQLKLNSRVPVGLWPLPKEFRRESGVTAGGALKPERQPLSPNVRQTFKGAW